jgi:CitMHS family citrate-Mg2+:H+ or citrate-Ca2+:H+ symporter
MILCAGTAIPYVGFEFTLGIPVLILGTFTTLFYGWKREGRSTKSETLARLPEVPAGMTWWRVLLPFLAFFGTIAAYRIWPFGTPILGLPLQFAVAAAVALAVSPRRIDLWALSRTTMKRLLPLLATMIVVGMLQQIMTATGVRGLLSYLVISAPLILLYVLLAVIIPVSEGVLTYGAAAILGIPLVWFFDSIGLHATVVIAGLSLLWPLGDGLPPTALIGRLSVMVSDYKDSYRSFLKATWLPWLVITVTAILMIIFSAKLSFLVRWSM